MAPVVLLLLLAEPQPVKLAAPPFSAAGVEPARARAWSDFFAQELHRFRISVITDSDMVAALGAEKQRELLGCTDSCPAELLGALNGDGLVLGSISGAEGTYVLNIRVLSPAGQAIAIASQTAQGEAAVIDALRALAAAVGEQLAVHFGPERVAAAPPRAGRISRRYALAPGAVGLALAVTGAMGLAVAAKTYGEIRDGSGNFATAGSLDTAIADGKTWNILGITALSAAGLAVIVTVVIYALGEPDPPPVVSWLAGSREALVWW